MKLYVKVSEDEYELPEAVAETKKELSLMIGRDASYASKTMKQAKQKGTKSTVIEVEVDDE